MVHFCIFEIWVWASISISAGCYSGTLNLSTHIEYVYFTPPCQLLYLISSHLQSYRVNMCTVMYVCSINQSINSLFINTTLSNHCLIVLMLMLSTVYDKYGMKRLRSTLSSSTQTLGNWNLSKTRLMRRCWKRHANTFRIVRKFVSSVRLVKL